jgi:exonuclease III
LRDAVLSLSVTYFVTYMRFGTWNVRSLYRSGSLKMVARELGKYKLDLVGVQEVRWDNGGPERAEDYTFFY